MSAPTEDPTPVTVVGPMRRSFDGDMFADLLRADVRVADHTITAQVAADRTRIWEVTFVGTAPGPALNVATTTAVRARMESTDDTDQARRCVLRADRSALAIDNPLRRLYDYTLGES